MSDFSEIYHTSAIGQIPLKNSLAKDALTKKAVELLVKEIQAIPNFENHRNDPELVLRVCNILETLSSSSIVKSSSFKETNVSKKDLVVSAFTEVFQLSQQEIDMLNNSIEFLWHHHKIVGVRKYKRWAKYAFDSILFLLNRFF